MKKIFFTTATALGIATSAIAGSSDPVVVSAPVIAAVAPAGTDWSGFYLGTTYGIGVDGNTEYRGGGPTISYPTLVLGSSYGAFAGYNVQRNKLVFGGEIAYSKVAEPSFGPTAFPASTVGYFLDAKARVGVTFNAALLYGFAGYTASHYTQTNVANNWDMGGLNYGVGVDLMLGSRMFVGAEYIVRDLSGPTTIVTGQTQYTNIQEVQIRAGLKF